MTTITSSGSSTTTTSSSSFIPTPPQQRPPPPPIPRRHPSRPSVGSASPASPSTGDSSPHSTYRHLLNNSQENNNKLAASHSHSPLDHHQHPPTKPPVSPTPPPQPNPTVSIASIPHPQGSDSSDAYTTSHDDHFGHNLAHGARAAPHSAILTGQSAAATGRGAAPSPSPDRAGSPGAPPVSPGMGRLGQSGLGLGAVGLGPVRIDFKDWVKAGREAREGTAGEYDDNATASRRLSKRFSLPHHRLEQGDSNGTTPNGDTNVSPSRGAESTGARNTSGSGRSTSSTEPRPLSFIGSAALESSLTSSNSMSSLSIDSNHSPQGLLARRASSRTSARAQDASEALRASTTTPRRTSHDLVRELSHLSLSNSASSQRLSLPLSPRASSPNPSSARSPLLAREQAAPSPLERRFPRRIPRTESSSGLVDRVEEEEEIETMVAHKRDRPQKSLEERLREADDRVQSPRDSHTGQSTPLRSRFTPSRALRSSDPPSRSGEYQRTEVLSSPPRNGVATPSGGGPSPPSKSGSSGGRMGKVRQPIPLEFQNGRLFTPSPKNEQTPNIDLNQSPISIAQRERERERSERERERVERERERTQRDRSEREREGSREPEDFNLASPRSQRSYATARPHSVLDTRRDVRDTPLRGWASRASQVGTPHSRSDSRSDFDRFTQSTSRRREFPTRNRPESVLETAADRDRYDSGPYTPSRTRFNDNERSARLSALIGDRSERVMHASSDFTTRLRELGANDATTRSPLSPNDSISAVGARTDLGSARKDPLDVIRRLEETRAQSNRRWEEDRSMSALGDRSPSTFELSRYGEREVLARPASRLDTGSSNRPSSRMSNASRIRPSSSMASVSTNRDSYTYQGTGTPRTQPMTRRRTTSTDDASLAESPLLGRTSRTSGSFSGSLEPRVVRRSQTSFGGRSAGSSGGEGVTTEHGRNLVDAAKVLDRKLEFDPEIISRLTAAAGSGERANAGVRAAAAIAAELAIDVDMDDTAALTTVRERLPRLAVTLREAGRSSDQAVRDLTDALLAIRGQATPSRATPQRRPESSFIPREPSSEPLHRRGYSTLDTPLSRHSQAYGSNMLANSPSARYGPSGRETPRGDHLSGRDRYDSGASASSSRNETNSTSSRLDGPRALDPIEQSPRSASQRTSPISNQRAAALRLSSPPPRTERSASRGHPPQPHNSPAQGAVDQVRSPEAPASTTPTAAEPEPGLRKQSSIASTHTVRPHSFVPSNPPEPTTALSNSPAYSQQSSLPLALAEKDEDSHVRNTHTSPAGRGHAKNDSIASTSSMYSRNGDPLSPTAATGPAEVQRMGTFGAAEGARVRASVSERFRKHLSGEHA